MFRHFAIFCLLILSIAFATNALAKTKKRKSKKGDKISHTYKPSKHARKSRRYHHGTGPDLKSITTESPYKEDPSNGVTPVETKQPGL